MPFLFFVHIPELLRILSSASSTTTARVLSLAVLILSVAPMGSIYYVLWGSHHHLDYYYYYYDGGSTSAVAAAAAAAAAATPPITAAAAVAATTTDGSAIECTARATTTAAEGIDGSPKSDWILDAHNANTNNNNISNTTLDDLWYSLFFGYPSDIAAQHPLVLLINQHYHVSTQGKLDRHVFVQHWKITIPWLVFFFFGVVIPTYLSIWSFFRQHGYRFMFRDNHYYYAGGKQKRHARYQKAVKLLEQYTKRLTLEDQVLQEDVATAATTTTTTTTLTPKTSSSTTTTTSQTSTSSSTSSKSKTTSSNSKPIMAWRLPQPGRPLLLSHKEDGQEQNEIKRSSSSSSSYYRQVVLGPCAICLNNYQLQDQIVWSPNAQCVHVFHHSCLLEWLLKSTTSNYYHNPNNNVQEHLCPCCRQPYCQVVRTVPTTSAGIQKG